MIQRLIDYLNAEDVEPLTMYGWEREYVQFRRGVRRFRRKTVCVLALLVVTVVAMTLALIILG